MMYLWMDYTYIKSDQVIGPEVQNANKTKGKIWLDIFSYWTF